MSKPKTAKEIVERFKKDIEAVYGVRFDEKGKVDLSETALGCPTSSLENLVDVVNKSLKQIRVPARPLLWPRTSSHHRPR